ncbi:MAG: UDP-N-acetylmuramoyl-L-alanine--D-glutamate ligase [Planctomycetaceae bacterium]|nr:UDP-N-acetylmuramoyl-L-alanine--D-glutamate ligase [Planctomycetaceae bacterium]
MNSIPRKSPDAFQQLQQRLRGQNAVVMGLGSFGGGVAAVRFLINAGARVTVTDLRSAEQLQSSIAHLHDCPQLQFQLESHPQELFSSCDLLVVNPAIRPDHPLVELARDHGADITTEIDLFLSGCRGRVVAVTGSNGKSTTTALIHHLLNCSELATQRRIYLGGNIGISLLDQLSEMTANDIVVLELSSFQLEFLRRQRFAPFVAVMTNFTPNHLDWHRNLSEYHSAKQSLLDFQTADQYAILPAEEGNNSFSLPRWKVRGRCLRFDLRDDGENGAFLDSGQLILRDDHVSNTQTENNRAANSRTRVVAREDVVRIRIPRQLPGEHNRRNLAAASAAAWVCGVPAEQIAQSLDSFQSLPHRLQLIAEYESRRFYDDSIATTPESAIAAISSFDGPIILFAGGYDKQQDLRPLAEAICRRVRLVVLMGQTAEMLETLLTDLAPDSGSRPDVIREENFVQCFEQAMQRSQPGDTILLSPGCASYGWFRDYRDRADQFREAVETWIGTQTVATSNSKLDSNPSQNH